ncbi:heme ABC transporter permease CcmC [Neisseria iguanae]|uniref:Heme exporter protein C n=1 Tax=Neisseria iguanae TaxID=90242 RepID=A0A2P7U0L6_9NEIS|nr:heme ABC transporter permease CcmC [Neisseria iguanae]PSJ80443.1 heme ABC transporter permease [Neisseria iguanae]
MNENIVKPFKIRRFASPYIFDKLAAKLVPIFFVVSIVLAVVGLIVGFLIAPADVVQGNYYRMMFLHVPASWMAMLIYIVMAFWSAVYLVWRTRVSSILAQALAPTGAWMAFLSLITGAIWGKPTWGAYWVWDARLTSMLLLLFLYIAYLALTNSIENERRASQAGALLAIVGVVNVPIIYFSVVWWNTLHQGASISFKSGVTMHETMFWALICMTISAWTYCIAMALWRARLRLRVLGFINPEFRKM